MSAFSICLLEGAAAEDTEDKEKEVIGTGAAASTGDATAGASIATGKKKAVATPAAKTSAAEAVVPNGKAPSAAKTDTAESLDGSSAAMWEPRWAAPNTTHLRFDKSRLLAYLES